MFATLVRRVLAQEWDDDTLKGDAEVAAQLIEDMTIFDPLPNDNSSSEEESDDEGLSDDEQ